MVRDVKVGLRANRRPRSAQYKEFEAHRRAYGFGQFLGVEEIAQKEKAVSETVDLFADMLGFTALGHGADARLISNEALAAQPKCRSANVVVDGVDGIGDQRHRRRARSARSRPTRTASSCPSASPAAPSAG